MESVEATGRTIEEAVEKALERLGRTEDEVDVVVLSEGAKGILGIGAEEARVQVTRRDLGGPLAEAAKGLLEEILSLMDIPAQVSVEAVEEGGDPPMVGLNLSGEYVAVLIGRRGETLQALQFILGLTLSRKLEHWVRVLLDAEGYRGRREQMLQDMAYRAAERAQQYRQAVYMEPLGAGERRVIHLALEDHPQVTTHSIGEGDNRRVVVDLRQEGPA